MWMCTIMPLMPETSLVVIGVVACASAAVVWRREMNEQRAHGAWCASATTKAEGVVSRIAQRGHLSRNEPTSGDEGMALPDVPIVRFKAADGVEYEVDAPDAPAKVGTIVAIAYDPALPSDARAIQRTPRIGCAVMLLAVGVVLLVLGLTR